MSDSTAYLVTGASSGIGLEVCHELLRRGKSVIGLSRRPSPIDHADYRHLQVDLSDRQIQLDLNSLPTLAGVLHGAGFLKNASIKEITQEEIEQTFRTNILAPIILTQAILPKLEAGSHLVHISSMGGFQGSVKFPGLGVYSASKAAIASLSEALAVELQDDGVKSNALAIGAVDTPMLRSAFPDYKAPLNASEMAVFISDFLLTGHHFFNGKVLPVSLSTP